MPSRIKKREHRLVLAHMLVDILRTLTVDYSGTNRYGSRAQDTALLLSIFIGQAEGRPMSPHKLADFAGLPRPTVIRRINRMLDESLLTHDDNGFVCLPVDLLNSERVTASVNASLRHIMTAAEKLSKLDNVHIAKRKARGR